MKGKSGFVLGLDLESVSKLISKWTSIAFDFSYSDKFSVNGKFGFLFYLVYVFIDTW